MAIQNGEDSTALKAEIGEKLGKFEEVRNGALVLNKN